MECKLCRRRGFHSAVLGEAVDTQVVFQRQVPGLFPPVLRTVEVPQLQYFQGGRCPCCCSSSTRCGRPCDYAATQSRSGRCHRFSSSPDLVGTQFAQRQVLQVGAMKEIFRGFSAFFVLLRVVPELSASFSSFRALTTVSARGFQWGCRSRRESDSKVTWHQVCQFSRHRHRCLVNLHLKQQQQYNLGRLRFNRRGASTPLWGVEACSPPSRRPNPIPAFPPYVVKTPHLHGAPTTEETVKL